jgi:hypothetical protein
MAKETEREEIKAETHELDAMENATNIPGWDNMSEIFPNSK